MMYLIGGQESHACGLYELGVCATDMWLLHVVVDVASGRPSATWRNLTSLPAAMEARCGSVAFTYLSQGTVLRDRHNVTIVGGQLSYNNSSCSSPPITVNEQWTLTIAGNGSVRESRRIDDASFSPRRWGSGDGGGGEWFYHFVNGGIRHVNVTRTGVNEARLTGSTIFAGQWQCIVNPSNGHLLLTCYDIFLNTSNAGGVFPRTSIPLPTAAAPTPMPALSFGGVMPAASIEQWRNTRPLLDPQLVDVEWSEVRANVTLSRSFDTFDLATLMNDRFQMPLDVAMNDSELNDRHGNYVRGTGWAVGYSGWFGYELGIATVHKRARAFADSPTDSSWWTPMAASSAATRRPLHNFDLRRRDHVTAVDPRWHSGGCTTAAWWLQHYVRLVDQRWQEQ